MNTISASNNPLKPFIQRSFYLDLVGYKDAQGLNQDIKLLGGTVETFLSKEINCLVTNKIDKVCDNSRNSSFKASSVSNEFPGAIRSNENSQKLKSRAEAIAEKAAQLRPKMNDALQTAKKLGIQVMPLQKVLKFIHFFKEKHGLGKLKSGSRKLKPSTQEGNIVVMLAEPFVKFEDTNRQFRPIFKQLKKWPELELDPQGYSSPFRWHNMDQKAGVSKRRVPVTNSEHDKMKSDESTQSKNTSSINSQRTPKPEFNRSGYCEICSLSYNHLFRHIETAKHKEFVADKQSYVRLDKVISSCPSLSDYISITVSLLPDLLEVAEIHKETEVNHEKTENQENAKTNQHVIVGEPNDSDRNESAHSLVADPVTNDNDNKLGEHEDITREKDTASPDIFDSTEEYHSNCENVSEPKNGSSVEYTTCIIDKPGGIVMRISKLVTPDNSTIISDIDSSLLSEAPKDVANIASPADEDCCGVDSKKLTFKADEMLVADVKQSVEIKSESTHVVKSLRSTAKKRRQFQHIVNQQDVIKSKKPYLTEDLPRTLTVYGDSEEVAKEGNIAYQEISGNVHSEPTEKHTLQDFCEAGNTSAVNDKQSENSGNNEDDALYNVQLDISNPSRTVWEIGERKADIKNQDYSQSSFEAVDSSLLHETNSVSVLTNRSMHLLFNKSESSEFLGFSCDAPVSLPVDVSYEEYPESNLVADLINTLSSVGDSNSDWDCNIDTFVSDCVKK